MKFRGQKESKECVIASKRTGNAIGDNCVSSIVSSLCSGANFHGRAKDINEFSFPLQDPNVSMVL